MRGGCEESLNEKEGGREKKEGGARTREGKGRGKEATPTPAGGRKVTDGESKHQRAKSGGGGGRSPEDLLWRFLCNRYKLAAASLFFFLQVRLGRVLYLLPIILFPAV